MKTTSEIIDCLRKFKSAYSKKYGISSLMLFGSVAREEQKENSDVDVCIKTTKPIDYFTLQDAQEEMQSLLGIKVDLLTMHDKMLPLFRKKIECDAIYI